MGQFVIHYVWSSTLASEAQPYQFPHKFTRFFREKYASPAVYRWRVMKIEGESTEPIYIGEAEDLATRVQRVRTPSRKAKDTDTNKRLNKIFNEYSSQGRTIVLDIAVIEPFEINGTRFGSETLGDRFKRRALEHLLLAIERQSKRYELLNVVIDPVEKVGKKLAQLKLPPKVQRELLRLYKLKTQQ